jgi:DNA-directed RNA polymerase specialized sigma24 family protein
VSSSGGDGARSSGEGDARAAIEGLFRNSWSDLVRMATFLTGSQPAAEDLVQDALVRFEIRQPLPDDPTSYLRKSVVNACRSYHRRRYLELRHRPTLPGPGLDNPSELWDILGRVSQRQRTALVLRYYLDLPEEEIAEILRCRPSTVRSLVQRGLAKLREELSE